MRDFSIKAVTTLSFLGAILLIIVYLLFSHLFALNAMREKTTDNVNNSVQIIGKRVDQNIKKIELCMVEKTISSDVVSVLTQDKKDLQYYIQLNRIRDGLNDDVKFLTFNSTLFIYYNAFDEIVMSGDQSNSLQQELRDLIYTYKTTEEGIWKVMDFSGEKYLMLMYYNELGVYAGALISIESILQEWENLNVIGFGKSQYFTKRDNGYVESSQNTDENEAVFRKATENSAETIEKEVWYGKNLIVKYNMLAGDYHVYIVVDSKYGAALYTGTWVFLLIIPILALIAFLIYYFVVNTLLMKPLQRVFSNIYTEMEKESIALPDIRGFSEVKRVVNMFNNILQNLHDVKIGLYEKKLENERAKMRILQSQINPHMFMNSMAIINSMSKFKTDESAEVICSLTKYMSEYFRFILESDHDFIDFDSEIKSTENYLKIQSIRYPELFHFNIEASNCSGIKIPPLMLQPIVENSVKHGFNGYENFTVNIDCSVCGEKLVIRVSDNGVGFSEESLQMIEKDCDTDIDNKRHFGIKNVYDLLKLAYPKGVIMKCFNDNGAVVEFTINL